MPLYLNNRTLSELAPSNMSEAEGNNRLDQTRAQVGEVVDVMRVNVEKVLERDSKLTDLNSRADNLQAGANQFQTQATRLKKKYWWQNMKMMIIIGVVVLVLLIIIIVSATGGSSGNSVETTVTPDNGEN